MKFHALSAAFALVLCSSLPAAAQSSVKLDFTSGRVSLKAENASLRVILSEWARLGGTRIVNGDKVVGAPVTLELTDVPERQALEVLLRSVSGYMLGPRPAGTTGASAFDRIMIIPTSTAPTRTTNNQTPAFTPQPARPPIEDTDPEEEPITDVADDPTQGRPTPGQILRQRLNRGFVPPNVNARPVPPQPFDADVVEEPVDDVPDQTPNTVTPGNPFGIPAGASTRPGTIAPVPARPPQNPQPDQEP